MEFNKGGGVRRRAVQSRSRVTVDSILDASEMIFAEMGFASATTTRIAEKTGVSIGSLYEYFSDKEAIIVAVVGRCVDRGLEKAGAALAAIEEAGGNLRDVLHALTGAIVDFYSENAALLHAVFNEDSHPPEVNRLFRQAWNALVIRLESTLAILDTIHLKRSHCFSELCLHLIESASRWNALHGVGVLSPEDVADKLTGALLGFADLLPALEAGSKGKANSTGSHSPVLNRHTAALLDLLLELGAASISDCEAALQVSRRTIQRNLRILIDAGLVIEVGAGPTDPRKRYKPAV